MILLIKKFIENINENASPINQLNFKEFSETVSAETIERFNDMKNVVETESHHPEEFFILYRLYEKLKKNNIEGNIEVDKSTK